MGQESKTIQPTQEDIDSAVEDVLRKSESPKEKAWREMEEQMASPEGIEDIKIPGWAKGKQEPNQEIIEKKQAFRTEYSKWEKFHSMGAMGIAGEDLPSHLDQDVNFKNQNEFEIPIEFADYLVSKALDGASGELLEELKNMLGELNEIEFPDILRNSNLILLTLKSKYGRIGLEFKPKYPFKFRAGKVLYRND